MLHAIDEGGATSFQVHLHAVLQTADLEQLHRSDLFWGSNNAFGLEEG